MDEALTFNVPNFASPPNKKIPAFLKLIHERFDRFLTSQTRLNLSHTNQWAWGFSFCRLLLSIIICRQ
jgi:hypothetical protein